MSVELLLKSHLKTLKLPTILQEYARAARQCAQEDRSFEEFLHYLVELEVAERQRKACQRRLKEAGFPTEKEIADFDFSALPTLNKKRILDLGQGHFIPKREGIVFLGPPGVGKTHLAIGVWTSGLSKRISRPVFHRHRIGYHLCRSPRRAAPAETGTGYRQTRSDHRR